MRNIAIAGLCFAAIAASSAAIAETAGQYIDDAAITTKVKSALMEDKNLKATQVSVKTDQGTVMLWGSVSSVDQEAEAVRVANQVNGVKIVKDELQVRSQEQ